MITETVPYEVTILDRVLDLYREVAGECPFAPAHDGAIRSMEAKRSRLVIDYREAVYGLPARPGTIR